MYTLRSRATRNGPSKVLSTVKKKSSRAGIPGDLEIFTAGGLARSAPEPCKTCGRPDQPERFHSHPKGSHTKIKDIPLTTTTTMKSRTVPVPKSVQKPVALNFRSDRNKSSRPEESETAATRSKPPVGSQDPDPEREEMDSQTSTGADPSAPIKRGRRTVTCYICGREFGTASFPIHEPKCMEVKLRVATTYVGAR